MADFESANPSEGQHGQSWLNKTAEPQKRNQEGNATPKNEEKGGTRGENGENEGGGGRKKPGEGKGEGGGGGRRGFRVRAAFAGHQLLHNVIHLGFCGHRWRARSSWARGDEVGRDPEGASGNDPQGSDAPVQHNVGWSFAFFLNQHNLDGQNPQKKQKTGTSWDWWCIH